MDKAKRLLKAAAGVAASWTPAVLTELLFLAGGVMIARGAWVFAEPLGWVVAGLLILLAGVMVARARA